MNLHSLKLKIILSSAVCIILLGVASNVYLYSYLTSIIAEKSDNIDRLNLETIHSGLDHILYQLEQLGSLCANDLDVAKAMRNSGLNTLSSKREALRAQETLKLYLSASNVEKYVTKLMAFNGHDLMTQAGSSVYNSMEDASRVRALPLYRAPSSNNARWTAAVSESIVDGKECIALLSPIYDFATSSYNGWLYIEMNMDWLSDIISPYGDTSFFISRGDGSLVSAGNSGTLPDVFGTQPLYDGQRLKHDGKVYHIQAISLRLGGLTLLGGFDVTFLSSGGRPLIYTVMVVIATSLVVAMVLAVLLSNIITRPLTRLMHRIRKISRNDLSYDPEIERGNDEIAHLGRMLNEMSGSIRSLLSEMEDMYKKEKNSEIALLQSQVNPHFLYNTLDSIHWMAAIQKNTGIMTMTKSLSALLKNLAKGVGDKIPLEEELSLLCSYVDIQSLRYMESFEFIIDVPKELLMCKIVKFTLQPLVENAIFHGVEPKGGQGLISVSASEDSGDLLITVRDDGVGMTAEELASVLSARDKASSGGLSGIGVQNVDERLKLVYGSRWGLTIRSEKNVCTEATVRIPKEV